MVAKQLPKEISVDDEVASGFPAFQLYCEHCSLTLSQHKTAVTGSLGLKTISVGMSCVFNMMNMTKNISISSLCTTLKQMWLILYSTQWTLFKKKLYYVITDEIMIGEHDSIWWYFHPFETDLYHKKKA